MAPKKEYTPLQMCNAIEAVKNGEKVAIAAKRFGVPRITLYNKVSGKSPVVCPMGPSTFLTYDEEKILEHWIIDMNNKHIPVTKEELLDSVQRIITDKGRATPFTENRPGKKWYSLFLKRHPIIAERTQNLKKEHFAPVLKTALESISEDCIENGFRGGGLYPFGPSYVDLSKIKSKQISTVDQTAQKHFLRCLETEIVSQFRSEKLQLFNELFYKGREELDSRLPEEDTSLYVLWASNKQAFEHSCQDNEASKSSQTLDPKVNEAPSTSTESDNDSPASILYINTGPSTQDFSSNKSFQNQIAQQEKSSQNKEPETEQIGYRIATITPISKNATTPQKEKVPRNEASEQKTDHPTVSILPNQEDLCEDLFRIPHLKLLW